jgi:CheY-like chemotaxis protein/class 3 adenylate cyclase
MPERPAADSSPISGVRRAPAGPVALSLDRGAAARHAAAMSSPPAERTLICTVVFADLVGHTRRPVAEQKVFKHRFSAAVAEAIEGVPEGERVIVDAGDGAALAFTVDPEDALLAALHLRKVFGQALRVGINLGPLQLIRDVNGQPGVVGDAINAANRVMSFAAPGEVLVSRSYRDAMAMHSAEYAALFAPHGTRTDKHHREHEVYFVGEAEITRPPRSTAQPRRAVRAVIAEDEHILREELMELLAKVWPELEIAAAASDGLAAMRAIEAERPDIVFLDIQMPGMTGIEVARSVGDRAHVVFLTANDAFAISAFEEGAVDYLLKPYSAARLYTACRRLRQRLGA